MADGWDVKNKMAIKRKLTMINLRSTHVCLFSFPLSCVVWSSRRLSEAAIFSYRRCKAEWRFLPTRKMTNPFPTIVKMQDAVVKNFIDLLHYLFGDVHERKGTELYGIRVYGQYTDKHAPFCNTLENDDATSSDKLIIHEVSIPITSFLKTVSNFNSWPPFG